MNKSELIDRIYEQYNINCSNQLYNKNIESGVKVIINTIIKSLSKGNRIEIRGFGGFNFNYRPARIGRNPKTGEKVSIPEKYVAHFKAGKELRERVNS